MEPHSDGIYGPSGIKMKVPLFIVGEMVTLNKKPFLLTIEEGVQVEETVGASSDPSKTVVVRQVCLTRFDLDLLIMCFLMFVGLSTSISK